MARGRSVSRARYKDGGVADATLFNKADGLTWRTAKQTRGESDIDAWLGKRGQAGRLAMRGFPKNNRFR